MVENTLMPSRFINREVSSLEFQRRIIQEAQEESNPLLERVKFLSIFNSNMDEFFMVRVSGIRKQVDAGIVDVFPDGLNPFQVLKVTRTLSLELYGLAYQHFHKKILPSLEKSGIHLLEYQVLNTEQKEVMRNYFQESIYPLMTPLAFDPEHPFPHIASLSINMAIVIKDENGRNKFAYLQVPDTIPRFLPISKSNRGVRKNETPPRHDYFVWAEQVIIANLAMLFPGINIVGVHPFRVLRDVDLAIQQREADDLLQAMEQRVFKSKFSTVVQLAVYPNMPAFVINFLRKQLAIKQKDLYVLPAPLGLKDLWHLYTSVERPELKFPPYEPFIPTVFRKPDENGSIFKAIRQKNILTHRPYYSFTPIVEFLYAAARDPNVRTIKQTIYRLEDHAVVIDALLEASKQGKEVVVLVELQARFDEESNISWARTLESAGVHVVYGVAGFKTHCKMIMVVRQESEGIRRYIHLATGNYNAVTSLVYEDIGIFTCDEVIAKDATDLFNYLTGYSNKQDYQKFLVAPINLRRKQEELIQREIENAKAGLKARLIFKMNSLTDPEIIKLLYEASQACVKVELLVRGICCLVAGVKGLSENIRVISIVGRFLEHSRVYYFYNNGKEEIYLSSADLMPRNLDYRIEVMFPVDDPAHIHYLRYDMIENYLNDNLHAHIMQPDGSYECVKVSRGKPFSVQEWLMKLTQSSVR